MDIPLDEVIHFDAIASSSTGAAADADSTPTFAVYEESTDTDIGVGGNFTKRTSLTGNYRGSFTASAANGFEVGKWYNVIGSATVGGVAAKGVVMRFRIVAAEATAGYPKVDTQLLVGGAQSAADLKDFADDGYDPSTNKVAGVVLADTLTTYTGNTPQTGDAYAFMNDNSTDGNQNVNVKVWDDNPLSGTFVSEVREAVGMASANLDTQLAAIEAQTDDIGPAGAGLTAIPWNASWDAEVQSEVTDALVASSIPLTVVSPLAVNSNLTLIRGDDYYNADGRAITFTFTSAPDITGATARFKWTVDGALVGTTSGIAGTVTSSTTCYFEFNSTHTTQTPTHTGNVQTGTIYRYDAEFTLTNGHVCTLARGELYLLADQRV